MIALVAVLGLATASAQDAGARRLFDQGNEALETGRFAEARDLFRESLALGPNAGTAFNLAVALRGTGQTIEAVEVLDGLIDGTYGSLSSAQREEAERFRTATAAEIAVVHVRVSGAPRVEVRLDGRRLATLAEGERAELRADPGDHVLTASAPRRETAEERIALDRGGSRVVELALRPSADARVGTLIVEAIDDTDVLEIVGVGRGTGTLRRELAPGSYEVIVSGPSGRRESRVALDAGETLRVRLDGESESVLASPWLWTGVSAVVLGLLIGGLFLFVETEDPPVTDPVYPVVTTLAVP